MAVLGLHAGVHRVSAIKSLGIIFVTLLLVRSRTRRKPVIEKFFTQPKTLSRLRSGLLGPHLPALASALDEAKYSNGSIRRHLRAADHFGAWLQQQAIEPDQVDGATIECYIRGLGRMYSLHSPQGRLPHKALGLRQFLELLRQRGALKALAEKGPRSSVEAWLAKYDGHLRSTIGSAPKTCENYLRCARRLLYDLFADAEIEWSKLTAAVIRNQVQLQAAKLKSGSNGLPITATRSLLRFLAFKGVVPEGLLGAVPSVLTWRHAAIPRAISENDVERVIAICDPSSTYGLRERAIVLLLARLGLRASEVIQLRIDDIEWVRGTILIRAGKTYRERSLPLSEEVGGALAAYLRQARPLAEHKEIFLRWKPPFRPLRSSVSICALTRRLLQRAGISVHRPGAHVFRHSLATRMVINGVSFKTVADVLGHQSIATTEIYAKLDLGSLSQVAMPWPGGER
jgi:site-specific recombinase XerD